MTNEEFLNLLRTGTPNVTVVGGGYVGLPLAVEAAANGCNVTVLDIDEKKVESINRGESYIDDVYSPTLKDFVSGVWENKKLRATTDANEAYAKAHAVLICVPTPLSPSREPDISFVNAVVVDLHERLSITGRGNDRAAPLLVVLESTVHPGYTRETLAVTLRHHACRPFVAFSPERIDPANKKHRVGNTPKVVGGVDSASTEAAAALYDRIISAPIVPVSSSDTAELVKLLENTYRAVNIALVNEFTKVAERLGINIWEVIDAAGTKPFGFQKFTPGPGTGGGCLDGKEWVCARHAGGVCIVPIEKLKYVVAASQYATSPGGVKLYRPRAPLEVLALDMTTGQPKFAKVTAISRRPMPRPLLDIHTRDHRHLRVTQDHPMLVASGDRLVVRTATDVRPGDHVPVVSTWPEDARVPASIDMIDMVGERAGKVWVEPTRGRWDEHDNVVRPACRAGKVAAKDVYRFNSLPLRIYMAMEQSGTCPFARDAVTLLTGRGVSRRRLPTRITIDTSFARLIGYYVSEGCITIDKKTVRTYFCFGSHEADLIDDCCGILTALGVTYSVRKRRQWKAVEVKVTSRQFAMLLRDVLRCGTRSENVRVPDALLAGSRELHRAVLAGMLRGDGSVYINPTGKCTYRKRGQEYEHKRDSVEVGYFSSSPELLQQALLLLQGIGVVGQLRQDGKEVRAHGQQVEKLTGLLVGEKRRRLEEYSARRCKDMPPKAYTPHGGYASVEVLDVTLVDPPEHVYSIEVEGMSTFVTSYGIAVHNCIPDDPPYLSAKMRELGEETRLLDTALLINRAMPRYVVDRLAQMLNAYHMPLNGTRVLVLGVAYKPNVSDTRESPALDIIRELGKRGAIVDYLDPHVPSLEHEGFALRSISEETRRQGHDAAIIVTNHARFDYNVVLDSVLHVLDTRGDTRHLKQLPCGTVAELL